MEALSEKGRLLDYLGNKVKTIFCRFADRLQGFALIGFGNLICPQALMQLERITQWRDGLGVLLIHLFNKLENLVQILSQTFQLLGFYFQSREKGDLGEFVCLDGHGVATSECVFVLDGRMTGQSGTVV